MNFGDGADRFDVFLSHASADRALAQIVQERLTDAGLTYHSSLSDLPARQYAEDHVQTVLAASRAYVAIASRSSVQAPAVLVEVGAAFAMDLPVIFLLNDLKPSELPAFFKRYPAFPLWKGFSKFVATVRKLPERVPA
jgi:TIR domain